MCPPNRPSRGRLLPRAARLILACSLLGASACSEPPPVPVDPTANFTEVGASIGVSLEHVLSPFDGSDILYRGHTAGVAARDVNGDGWVDIFAVGGDAGSTELFLNDGDGTFTAAGAERGLSLGGDLQAGPTLVDHDADGDVDLLLVRGSSPSVLLYSQQDDGTFVETSVAAGLDALTHTVTWGTAFGDYDGDGDLDLFATHWGYAVNSASQHLWRNEGALGFVDASDESGVGEVYAQIADFTFAPAFSDIDDDGDLDLLVTGDFDTSRVMLNDGAGHFTDATTLAISDENGMGMALGDFDNDGRMDWFVASIYAPDHPSPEWGTSGNRLYRGLGDGTFEDVTEEAGVRDGGWGWAACMADFDNDGHIDILNTTGYALDGPEAYLAEPFNRQVPRLFLNLGDGTFAERAEASGFVFGELGKAISCFDYDRDGDVDVVISSTKGPLRVYRNDLLDRSRSLLVRLEGLAINRDAIGARLELVAGGLTQLREIRLGSNFLSHDPPEAHFGLGPNTSADTLRVRWPDGSTSVHVNIPAGEVVLQHP